MHAWCAKGYPAYLDQIIEGVVTIAFGMVVWMIMPDYPATTMWLTPEERLLAAERLAYDGLANAGTVTGRIGEWEATKMAIRDWRTWLLAFVCFMNLGAQTISYFIPTLVGALGWTGYEGQCEHLSPSSKSDIHVLMVAPDHTIPLWAFAFVCVLVFSWLSDKYQNKAYFIALTGAIGCFFFILTVSISNLTAKCECLSTFFLLL